MRNRNHDPYYDRSYNRYSAYDEPETDHPYDYPYRWRYPSSRSQYAARPYPRGRDRLAFDAGEPQPPRRSSRWRRYLDELGRLRHQTRRHFEEREPESEALLGRGRQLARRYKEPIIGAAIAGVAMPFAFGAAGGGQQAQAQPAESEPIGEPVPLGRPMPKSVEEDVGHRLASLKNARIREATIDGAMTAYGITRSLAEQIHDIAISNDIEPELAFGLVKTESAFDNRAVSNVGARGLTQVMPRTARWLRPGTTIEDLYNRQLNLDMGFGYLRDLIDKYKGDVRLALLAYNRGPGTVDRVLDAGGNPDNGYADKVLEGYDDLG